MQILTTNSRQYFTKMTVIFFGFSTLNEETINIPVSSLQNVHTYFFFLLLKYILERSCVCKTLLLLLSAHSVTAFMTLLCPSCKV